MPNSEVFFADAELARRLEATDAQVGVEAAGIHAQIHPESGATSEAFAGGFAVFLGIESPLTQAIGLGMHGPVTLDDLRSLEDFFTARGAPTRIELCPFADASLRHLLSDRGYRVLGHSNMLVRQVRAIVPSSAQIEAHICSPSDATLWAGTVAQGFAESGSSTDETIRTLITLFQKPYATAVLARLDGEPVGGGAMSIVDSVAAFYGASTISQFRRKGVQTAIIRALLVCAQELHCDIAYTLTQPGSGSQRNVERQGFRVAYTRTTFLRGLPPM
jgi:hypothetical protein